MAEEPHDATDDANNPEESEAMKGLKAVGWKVLAAVDYVGETLAALFGITDSKYSWAQEEYDRRQWEKEQEDKAAASSVAALESGMAASSPSPQPKQVGTESAPKDNAK